MIETVPALLSAEEFFEFSFHNRRAELIEGEVFDMSLAGGEHGLVTNELGTLLTIYVRAHKLGRVCAAETGFIVRRNPDTVRAPDVAFISHERMGNTKRPKKFWPFAPDLAVEVVSPSDIAEEIEQKVRDWFQGGTLQVWIVYPATRVIHVYRSATDVRILQEGDTLSDDAVVPGFSCSVADIFA